MERSVKGLATLPQEVRRWLRSAKQSEVDPQPIARLQNPESQTVYASYMVRFVCFYLRIIEDDERRLQRAIGQALASPSRHSDSSNSKDSPDSLDSEDSSNSSDSDKDSGKDSSNSRSSKDRRYDLQSRRATRRQGQVDKMKDARELFTFTAEQQRRADRL